ncbi:hypothetical protein [Olsenella sp. Marseille-P4559]|nr:hypothetical protein [Olsenella sp. Marseille-P4559]
MHWHARHIGRKIAKRNVAAVSSAGHEPYRIADDEAEAVGLACRGIAGT